MSSKKGDALASKIMREIIEAKTAPILGKIPTLESEQPMNPEHGPGCMDCHFVADGLREAFLQGVEWARDSLGLSK